MKHIYAKILEAVENFGKEHDFCLSPMEKDIIRSAMCEGAMIAIEAMSKKLKGKNEK